MYNWKLRLYIHKIEILKSKHMFRLASLNSVSFEVKRDINFSEDDKDLFFNKTKVVEIEDVVKNKKGWKKKQEKKKTKRMFRKTYFRYNFSDNLMVFCVFCYLTFLSKKKKKAYIKKINYKEDIQKFFLTGVQVRIKSKNNFFLFSRFFFFINVFFYDFYNTFDKIGYKNKTDNDFWDENCFDESYNYLNEDFHFSSVSRRFFFLLNTEIVNNSGFFLDMLEDKKIEMYQHFNFSSSFYYLNCSNANMFGGNILLK